MLGLFGHKKRINKLRQDVQDSFNHVKKDFNKVGEWIKHLDDKHQTQKNSIEDLKEQIFLIQEDLLEIKDFISFFGPQLSKGLSKQAQTERYKQLSATTVQTPVQTPVQTGILESLTLMERAIVWTLLNSEMNLSYEDLAALLGKDKSTIRGQINAIKQKSKNLIEESKEINGKKRLFIPEKIKINLLKGIKVKIDNKKSSKIEK